MAIVASPENLKNLARYQDIARKLAAAEGLSSDQAHACLLARCFLYVGYRKLTF
jgi:hypothetical protein